MNTRSSRPVRIAPYGSWESPLTAAALLAGGPMVSEVVVDGSDVYWSESRPNEGGRVAVMRSRDGEVEEVTSAEANVRTRVHEYGGGAWWVDSGVLYYVDDTDQRLRRLADGQVTMLTPEPPVARGWRYADGRVTPDGRWFICVREKHHDVPGGAYLEPDNQLVAVATDGSGEIRELVVGADFYSNPRPSPTGEFLAWIQWNHPNMPWDGTELWVGELVDGQVVRAQTVVGGSDEAGSDEAGSDEGGRDEGGSPEAIAQPEWSPGSDLFFLSDRTGWSNVYRLTDQGPEVEIGGEFDVGGPMWVFGQSRYAIAPDGSLITALGRPYGDVLLIDSTDEAVSGWSTIASVRALPSGGTAFVGATHRAESAVVAHEGEARYVSPPRVHGLPDSFLPEPETISFETSDGSSLAHGLFYAPANPRFEGPAGELPPLLVLAHGGPTAAARRMLQLSLRYWTSRGWAVVDVDYRGSTGYGRSFMRSLDGQWGVADVDDCIAAAQHLVTRGDADPDRLAIRGGSAGGYTVLSALTFRDVFSAGASRYGIGDLAALATDTHKFESRYLDRLVAPYSENEPLYRERSPIDHTERLSCPMIILQGLDDKVVPPNQAEAMVEALRAKGIAHAYLPFEGEGHGFRRAETIIAALEAEYSFFAQVFGFEPAGEIPVVAISSADGAERARDTDDETDDEE